MQVSQRVQPSSLEKLNLTNNDGEPKTVLIVTEMQSAEKTKLTELLQQYKDVFAWSFEAMKGLDLALC